MDISIYKRIDSPSLHT